MRHLKSILIAILATVVLLGIISYFLDSQYKIEKKITIASDPEEVYTYIADLKKWPRWTAWNDKKYNSLKISYAGPETGPGSVMNWKAEGDEGQVKINGLEPGKNIFFDVLLEENFITHGVISLSGQNHETTVRWSMSGDVGNDYLQRYFILFVDQFMSSDMETGLENLKKICEKD